MAAERRSSEVILNPPVNSLSVLQIRKENTVFKEKRRLPKPHKYHAFTWSLTENIRESNDVCIFLKSHGFYCADSNYDIKPNQLEYQQVSNMMRKSQWIVLMLSKLSFTSDLTGHTNFVIGIALEIAVQRNKRCILSLVHDKANAFVPNELSLFFQVDVSGTDRLWQAKILNILGRRPDRQVKGRSCYNPVHTLYESLPEISTQRRCSLPVDFKGSLAAILKKRHFEQPLIDTLAVIRHQHNGKTIRPIKKQHTPSKSLPKLPKLEDKGSQHGMKDSTVKKKQESRVPCILPSILTVTTEPQCVDMDTLLPLSDVDVQTTDVSSKEHVVVSLPSIHTEHQSKRNPVLERMEQFEQKCRPRELKIKPKRH